MNRFLFARAVFMASAITLNFSADRLDAEPWPIKEFEVAVTMSIGLPLPDAALLTPEAKLEIENYLTQVAALYESWGFGPPELGTVFPGADGRDVYRIFIVDGLLGGAAGQYNACLFGHIEVNAASVLDSNNRLSDFGALTLAHELFHAVTWGTPFFSCTQQLAFTGSWISEGLADAVSADAVRVIWKSDPQLNAADEWGRRRYHRSLPVPLGFFQHDRGESSDQYATASFWRYLAESHALGEPAGPEYRGVDYSFVPPMLAQDSVLRDCNSRGSVCAHELRWADFHIRNTFGRPMRDMFARFMQAYVQYPEVRPMAEPGAWFDKSFAGCPDVLLRAGAGRDGDAGPLPVAHVTMNTQRNAVSCFAISIDPSDAPVRLRVRVHDSTGLLPIQNISAVVGQAPSSVPSPVFSVPDDGTGQSAAWTFEISPEDTTYLILSNMADDPGRTTHLFGLPVDLVVLEDRARMGASTGPAQVFGAMPIELDRIQMKSVIPMTTELLRLRGLTKACSLRLVMTNSVTGDGVEVQLDHPGPITPGTYDVALLEDGFFEGPEEHIGAAVLHFGIGAGNPLAQGDAQSYGGQTGTLVIDAFTEDLLSGSVTVLGERAFDGVWEADGWRAFPDELSTLAVQAEFSLEPALPSGVRSMHDCLDPDPRKRTRTAISSTTGGRGGNGTEPAETVSGTSRSETTVLPSDTSPDLQDATEEGTREPGASPAADDGRLMSVECRPLLFEESTRFVAEGLPFSFGIPRDWEFAGDDETGRIWPVSYPGGGIEYRVRRLNEQEARQAMALNQAMFPEIASLRYGADPVPIYGQRVGDMINMLFVLPAPGDHFSIEVLFKGRNGCDPSLIEKVQNTFLESLSVTP